MKRLNITAGLLLLLSALVSTTQAQLTTCAVTATAYSTSGALLPGAQIRVVKIVKNNVTISNTPVTYTTGALGTVTFNLPRSSTAWIYFNGYGLNTNGTAGVAVTVPNAATANLEDLANLASVLTTLGDTVAASSNGVPVRVGGNTSSTFKLYGQQGNGTTSNLPAWVTPLGSGSLSLTYDNSLKTLTLGYTPSSAELLAGFGAQSANTFPAGPTSGSAAVPTWRALVSADLPSHTHALSNLTQSGATSNQVPQWNGSAWVPATFNSAVWGDITGTLANQTDLQTALNLKANLISPSFTTPNLGTPSAGVLTNATGLPVSTGIAGLGTGVATALGVNTGSAGAFVLFNGALGTPSSGTLTNATGLPPTTGIAGWPANSAGALTNDGAGNLSWGAGGTTINSSDGFIPYRSNSTTFADSPISRIDATTVQVAAINGGAAANDDLILQGTSNATRTSSYTLLEPNGGKVGIGISSPLALLHVGGQLLLANNAKLSWRNVAGSANIDVFNVNVNDDLLLGQSGASVQSMGILRADQIIQRSTNLTIGTNGALKASIITNSTERLTADSAGLIGIGTLSPTAQLDVRPGSTSTVGQVIRLASGQTANALNIENSTGTLLSGVLASGAFYSAGIAFASLGTPSNGTFVYCTDCTIASPCAGSGTGALAKRLNGAWVCN